MSMVPMGAIRSAATPSSSTSSPTRTSHGHTAERVAKRFNVTAKSRMNTPSVAREAIAAMKAGKFKDEIGR